MEERAIRLNDRIISIFMKIFIVVAIIFPFTTKYDAKNTGFILSNLICFIMLIASKSRPNIRTKNNKFSVGLLVLVILYNLVCGYYNIYYHHYYIEQINKTISFIFFIVSINKFDEEFIIENKIIEFLVISITITCLLSIVYYFSGGDAVSIENFSITLRKQGMFPDNRLTWVYGHKSVYGLMLALFFFVILRYYKLFKHKVYLILSGILVLITIFLSGSSTTLGLLGVTIIFIIISKYNFKKRFLLSFFLVIGLSIVAYFGIVSIYTYIDNTRDISTIGNRTYIYQAAKFYLSIYPEGVGRMFGNINMLFANMDIDNLHNIFLNEMLRFSISVGLIYTIIFIYVALYTIKINKLYAVGVWITCFGLFVMDFSLTTEFLSIFFFLIYLLFFVKSGKVERYNG